MSKSGTARNQEKQLSLQELSSPMHPVAGGSEHNGGALFFPPAAEVPEGTGQPWERRDATSVIWSLNDSKEREAQGQTLGVIQVPYEWVPDGGITLREKWGNWGRGALLRSRGQSLWVGWVNFLIPVVQKQVLARLTSPQSLWEAWAYNCCSYFPSQTGPYPIAVRLNSSLLTK